MTKRISYHIIALGFDVVLVPLERRARGMQAVIGSQNVVLLLGISY
jgi:hypothetical protein